MFSFAPIGDRIHHEDRRSRLLVAQHSLKRAILLPIMKSIFAALFLLLARSSEAFAPVSRPFVSATHLSAKYNSMDEILALFPEDKPILINFYDANTESAIKDDIMRAKKLLEDRATLVSIKQQDYPEIAKLWDCDKKSPSMILFKDGKPVTRLYEQTFYLDIVAKVGTFCKDS